MQGDVLTVISSERKTKWRRLSSQTEVNKLAGRAPVWPRQPKPSERASPSPSLAFLRERIRKSTLRRAKLIFS